MGASGDGSREERAKLSIGGTNTGGTKTLFEVVPHLLDRSKVGDSDLDGGGEAQGNITECSLSVIVPVVSVIVTVDGLSSRIDKPLALCPKVGLHRGVPLLPVGASEHRDHLVESAGHGEFCWVNGVSKSMRQRTDKKKKKHLSASESTSVNS